MRLAVTALAEACATIPLEPAHAFTDTTELNANIKLFWVKLITVFAASVYYF
jgi:hypothetical protein